MPPEERTNARVCSLSLTCSLVVMFVKHDLKASREEMVVRIARSRFSSGPLLEAEIAKALEHEAQMEAAMAARGRRRDCNARMRARLDLLSEACKKAQ